MIARSIQGLRRADVAEGAAPDGAIVEGVVDMMSVCAYALVALKKTARWIAPTMR
jgi:hypothetical protein